MNCPYFFRVTSTDTRLWMQYRLVSVHTHTFVVYD